MRANERLNEIVKLLNNKGRVHVKDLSERFQVTEDLIRKDLKKLEERDLIDRIHGGAERKTKKFDASNVKYRMNLNKEDKEKLAKKADKLIENGDTIFLDTSTTSATIASVLAKGNKEITVITNMLEIVRILEENNDIRTILVGGLYNRQIGGFVGHEAIETIREYYVDKSFVSCMGMHLKNGMLISSTKDIGYTKRAILESSKEKIFVAETRKLEMNGRVSFFKIGDLDKIIFERPLDKKELESFEDYEIELI